MASAFLGAQRFEVIVDRDKFEKELSDVMHKLLNATEAPPKEKHVRSTLIATWREKGCSSFWRVMQLYPLLRSHIVCWKACFVVHRAFRDGHPYVCKKSAAQMRLLSDIGKHWSHAVAGYAPLITGYIKVLMTRITFQIKNPEIPASLNFEDSPFKVPTDIDYVFQLTVEVFDLQSSLLHFYAAIMTNMDPSRGVTASQIQCRLAPLVPAIQDSAALYDLTYKLMKALHSSLPADTLVGHRDRFNRQYQALRKYFHEASKLQYLQSLVRIPSLTPDPPSFLLPGNLVDELGLAKQVRVVAEEESMQQTGTLVDPSESSLNPFGEASATASSTTDARFEDEFGSEGFEQFDFSSTSPLKAKPDEKDALIEQLMREIVELKEKVAELQDQRDADHELMSGLRESMHQLETELADYKDIAEQTCNENVLLKKQIDASQTEHGAQAEAEVRARASEEKFSKLREVYQKLRGEHIQLLRTDGEVKKTVQSMEAERMEAEDQRKGLEERITSLGQELEESKTQTEDEAAQMTVLREEIRRKEAHSLQLEQVQQSLNEQLLAKEESAPHKLIVEAIGEAEDLIKRILEELSHPSMGGTTCTPAFLLQRTKSALDVIDTSTANFSLYNNNPSSIGKALSSLPSLSHSVSEVMLQGVATSHMAPEEDGQKLVQSCQAVGEETLKYLAILKQERPGSGTIATGANDLQKTIRALGRLAEELVPTQAEEATDSLGDIVDEEMTATALAVEAAAMRIQEMLRKAREDDTGVKLEVNERILDSCTDLMKAIKVLIERSKDLQLEIVGEGMGSLTSVNEYHKKNSRWSEGLISAAKQVGWGASVLLDAADKVVQGTGKFEELVVSSHDIAASTAQLVAASRVKARPKSEKLKSLKSSSRAVSEATGQVVASAQSGAELNRNSEAKMDYSKLSLTQAKRLEMESQVKALELEKELEMERTRLAELRKFHYHLAGASEGWEEQVGES